MSDDRTLIIETTHLGDPVSKGRARVVGRGPSRHAYTPPETRAAEEAWQWVLRAAAPSFCTADTDYDYRIEVDFYTSSWRRRDLDNMVKLVSDACNKLVYADDAQVTQLEASVTRGDDRPRTELRIYRLPAARPPTTKRRK